MFDYEATQKNLELLHEATSHIPGYFRDQVKTFIYVGEYGLALDTIAGAYLSNKLRMPADLFAVFEHLADEMELDSDPEFDGVKQMRQFQRSGQSHP